MESVTSSMTEGFLETNINFNSHSILAVFDETRPHTGYSIRVNQVLEKSDHLLLKVRLENKNQVIQF